MAQLVVTAGQAALNGVQALAPTLASTAANMAVNALFAPHREGPRLTELPVQTSTDGAPMARIWGRGRVAGQVIWASRFLEHRNETGGGKGGPSRTDYTYSLSFAVGLCAGGISGIGRVWANGALLDRSRYPVRVHTGAGDQLPDALIQAIEGGDAPAFRGTAYAVMEDWPLDAFGNRIPNLSFEVFRPAGSGGLERQVRGVNLIPGSGEFAYAVDPVMRELGPGREAAENVNNSRGLTDLVAALDDLERDLPECRSVQLVLSWFGNDLRCAHCEIRPGVEVRDKLTRPAVWSVAGQDRASAHLVSQDAAGRPVYGGTPDDASVVAAIQQLRARGYAVSLYPFILMDIPAGNGLPDPHGGAEQAAYPWRGRITSPADGSAAATGDVADFFGTARASDFTVSGTAVSYHGPATRLSYAADWSEYSGHQPGAGAKVFHLDPLWSHSAIDAVAIDWYVPLSDWRDGEDHLDAQTAGGPHDADYLAAGAAGGEGYDWYYASPADRDAQIRTPIADGVHGEDWIWRYKDLAGWWSNPHHDRPGGVRDASPTGWVPMSKPVWITEAGCPAIDKGANQPNVFSDPKSAESALPYFSSGARDDLIQRRYLEAVLSHWEAPANNPVSPVYGGPMIDPGEVHVWTWDARPWPDFPTRTDVWSDGPNWDRGHWLNGRAGQVPVAAIIADLAADAGIGPPDLSALDDLVSGYAVDRPMSVRAAVEPLADLLGFGVFERAGAVHAVSAGHRGPVFSPVESADDGQASRRRTGMAPAELPRDVALGFIDDTAAYRPGHASARETFGTVATLNRQVCVIADPALARRWCAEMLADIARTAPLDGLVLPPSALAVEAGDRIEIDGRVRQVKTLDGAARRHAAAAPHSLRRAASQGAAAGVETPGPAVPSRPLVAVLDLPLLPGETDRAGPFLAAHCDPWPGRIVYHARGAARAESRQPARVGRLVTPLEPGPPGRWDRANAVELELYAGNLSSAAPQDVLAGANRLAVEGEAGEWEILGFATADLTGPSAWRLSGLLRGLCGSVIATAGAGSGIVLLNGVGDVLPVAAHEIGSALTVTAVPDGLPVHHAQARSLTVTPLQRHWRPLPPVHVRARLADEAVALDWIRQSRIAHDDWGATGMPLGEAAERYRVRCVEGGQTRLSVEVTAPLCSLPLADIDAAFGARPARLDIAIAQISERFGAGLEAQCSIDL
jgi:hypothetical protein